MDNSEQIDYWNGQAGERWREEADALDKLLEPFVGSVIAALPQKIRGRVLDIGCGAGALSLAIARRFGSSEVTGVDVSRPMLALARERAADRNAKIEFIESDASNFVGREPFNGLVSRFGVMFFEDPHVAFKHLHGQMTKDAPISFVCWRPASENEWVMAPMMAALQFMDGPPPQPEPRRPGPFAFAESDYIKGVLQSGGWQNVKVEPWDGSLTMPGENVAEVADFSLGIGPLARVIADQDIDRDRVKNELMKQLQGRTTPDGSVKLNAAAWIVSARA